MNLNIGILSFSYPVFCHDIAQKYLNDSTAWLEKQGHNVTAVRNIVMTEDDVNHAISAFRKNQVDMVVVELGSFTEGNLLVQLTQELKNIPFFVWAFDDPVVDDFPTVPLNCLTGLTLYTSFLYRFHKKFEYVYAPAGSKEGYQKLSTFMRVLAAVKGLRKARYLVVGSRVPGFFLCMLDEMRVRDVIGPEISYYSIATWLRDAENIDNSRADEAVKQFCSENIVRKENFSDKIIQRNIRLELALMDYIHANHITGVTIKCWPELQDLYGCSACSIISRMNDNGIVASCEGDVGGLISMDILHRLSGKTVYFADPVGRTREGAVKMWHCGLGPTSLAAEGSRPEFTHQATMRNGIGMGVMYTMKTGRVTMAKVSDADGKLRLFAAEGTSVDPDRKLLGVQTDILLDRGFDQTLETIVNNGIEHHYAIVHDEMLQDLKQLCKWLEIEFIEP